MLLKAAPQFRCLDPATSFIGTQYQATLGTDHPGGKPGVPNEDYKGGRSGFYGSLNIKGYVGLVIDYNSNGQVDLDDGMLEPQPIGEDGGFVVGLPSYGSYIPFTVDGASYGTLTSWGPGAYSVYDGLLWLCTLFQGMGRFEASVGALGVGGMEYPYDVDAAETLEDVDGQILQFKVDFRF
jgi:hypothetical protein